MNLSKYSGFMDGKNLFRKYLRSISATLLQFPAKNTEPNLGFFIKQILLDESLNPMILYKQLNI
jgi:hypothetical protein